MDFVTETVARTPWWVFLIFALVTWMGIKALRTRVVALHKLAVAPVIFAVWGVSSLFQFLGPTPTVLTIFGIAVLVGAAIGWALSRLVSVRPVGGNQVEISGSPLTLILILIIFVSKYAIGFMVATNPQAAQSLGFVVFDAGVTGVVIGIFLGRLAGLHTRYQAALAARR